MVIIEKICLKLIITKLVGLNRYDYYKLKFNYIAKHKNKIIKIENNDFKAKTKQLKNKISSTNK